MVLSHFRPSTLLPIRTPSCTLPPIYNQSQSCQSTPYHTTTTFPPIDTPYHTSPTRSFAPPHTTHTSSHRPHLITLPRTPPQSNHTSHFHPMISPPHTHLQYRASRAVGFALPPSVTLVLVHVCHCTSAQNEQIVCRGQPWSFSSGLYVC